MTESQTLARFAPCPLSMELGFSVALLVFVSGCEARSGGPQSRDETAVMVETLEVELEVFDARGRAQEVELSLRDMVEAALAKTRHLEMSQSESGGAVRRGRGKSGRLRVWARFSPDLTKGELYGRIEGRLDRVQLVPLDWEVERRTKLSKAGMTKLDGALLEGHMKALVSEVVDSLDRQVGTARLKGARLTQALADDDTAVVSAAARVLGQDKSVEAVGALCRTLERDEKRLQSEALDALSSVGDRKGVDCIKAWAGADQARLEEAIGAVGTIGGGAAREYLEDVAKAESSSPAVRRLALAAVSKIKGDYFPSGDAHDHDHGEELEERRANNPLITALTDSDSKVRVAAALEIARTKRVEAVEPLCDLLEHDDPMTVEAALTALAELRSTKAVPCLTRWGSEDDAKLALVIEALATIGGRESRSVLQLLVREHPSPVIRELARDGFARSGEGPREME